jgi:hypothetical protein
MWVLENGSAFMVDKWASYLHMGNGEVWPYSAKYF